MADQQTNIIEAVRRGDESAFRQLVEKHYRYVYGIVWRVLLNDEAAKDAAQETFIKVWQSIGMFSTRTNFTTWLYRIAANTALDAYRSRARRSARESEAAGAEPIADLHATADTREAAELVTAGLVLLSPVQRLVMALRDFEDLPVRDVVEVTGLSEASVKTNLSYARKRVREFLAVEYGVTGATP